ncbi:MAG: DUF3800 domain-containing protein [Bacteroidota bacterium]|nr:hypothetical protein [Odoribacter sp.]MDP3642050.1 DUF3800 domain-containing protein [Bacteroidota bacterium]
MVYFCYIDESGTPEVPGNTSHYVLAGLSIPISCWKFCERGISKIKQKYDLENSEIHTGWIVRKFIEQSKIVKFEDLTYAQRRYEVGKIRKMELLKLQKSPNNNLYKQTRKNYRQTEAYIHLTLAERIAFIQELADLIGGWSFARLFAESINKVHFDPLRAKQSVDEQALEQLVSRFEQYMKIVSKSTRDSQLYGTLIHDNNETVSKKHTALMKKFHSYGTLWTSIEHIIETPFFVNSELTSLIQIADLCCYSLRRYFENNEIDLLDRIQNRFDRKNGKIVGVRHFTDSSCQCRFCHKN